MSTVRRVRSLVASDFATLTLALACAFALTLSATVALAQSDAGEAPSAASEEAPPVSAEFRAALKKYLEVQGSYVSYGDTVAYQAANETLMSISANGVQVTEPMQQIVLEEAQAKFGEKFRDLDFLTRIMVPVYAKYFSAAELEEMTEFWSSPVGRKNLEMAGTLNQESLTAIQQVTFGITPAFQLAVDARMRELGYDVVPIDPSAGPAAP